ncbi:MAG: dTDP-4-dehydrorhamnose reductase [Pseudomonadales bacterium]|nr:dTDP-4-dehydrorhamnose reductase [Halieaceae bacterium]MCP5163669.1 dTDP-4-dehydrorhamnose reductase [Pseudomonadales bacterium]MCP5189293.1 dTDP-4-dehydrorhamnose reductase [Pseudomonadales bacterium]MCP5204448.1 dTDP-4-dehydrorhamnose reductase [Pseudomonadales bacterium]
MSQTVVIVGAGGQLGMELVHRAPAAAQCIALARSDLDISDNGAVVRRLAEIAPALVVNAAAFTGVDAAESEQRMAHAVNAAGAAHLAQACRDLDARLIHVSTDFVFDGQASRPYPPTAPTAPLGEYGRSKLAGEQAVQQVLPRALVLRTGWVYSRFGGNFVKTMLRLMAEREQLAVVDDQVGTPTWASGLARAIWAAAAHPQLEGILHWSDAGVCSWYDFAVAICEEAVELGLLARPVRIRPIPASDYPTPARRPHYSVLDKTASWRELGLEGVHWRVQLRHMLKEYREMGDE